MKSDKVISWQASENKILSLKESEKMHIFKVLKLTGFNILRSATLLEISRPRIYREMKEYGLDIDSTAINEDE